MSAAASKASSEPKAVLKDPRPMRPIPAARVQFGHSARNVFRAVAPMEDTPEQIVDPQYWIHCQHQLRPYDIIEVVPDDMKFFMELLVLGVQRNYVEVAEIRRVELPAARAIESVPSGYEIKHAGPHEKFRVLLHGKVLVSQLETAAQARSWLDSHIKAK